MNKFQTSLFGLRYVLARTCQKRLSWGNQAEKSNTRLLLQGI